ITLVESLDESFLDAEYTSILKTTEALVDRLDTFLSLASCLFSVNRHPAANEPNEKQAASPYDGDCDEAAPWSRGQQQRDNKQRHESLKRERQERVDDARNDVLRLLIHIAEELGRIALQVEFLRGIHIRREEMPRNAYTVMLRHSILEVGEPDQVRRPDGKHNDQADRTPYDEFGSRINSKEIEYAIRIGELPYLLRGGKRGDESRNGADAGHLQQRTETHQDQHAEILGLIAPAKEWAKFI